MGKTPNTPTLDAPPHDADGAYVFSEAHEQPEPEIDPDEELKRLRATVRTRRAIEKLEALAGVMAGSRFASLLLGAATSGLLASEDESKLEDEREPLTEEEKREAEQVRQAEAVMRKLAEARQRYFNERNRERRRKARKRYAVMVREAFPDDPVVREMFMLMVEVKGQSL